MFRLICRLLCTFGSHAYNSTSVIGHDADGQSTLGWKLTCKRCAKVKVLYSSMRWDRMGEPQ